MAAFISSLAEMFRGAEYKPFGVLNYIFVIWGGFVDVAIVKICNSFVSLPNLQILFETKALIKQCLKSKRLI